MPNSHRCGNCRFWSEMIAKSEGVGGMLAICLSDNGLYSQRYTGKDIVCASWKSGHFGAIDAPPNLGEVVRSLYLAEEQSTRYVGASLGEEPPVRPKYTVEG